MKTYNTIVNAKRSKLKLYTTLKIVLNIYSKIIHL